MSSYKSTEKPTGPCAACQKEGALLRCVACRDVGVDIFFCNRDCQVQLWKTHKAVCGKASTSDDSVPKDASSEKNRAKSFGKFLKKTNKKYLMCYNCMKTEKDVKLSSCTGCDGALYCSQECQKAHWPKHKEICKHDSATRQLVECFMTPSQKNIQNLFDQWKSKPMSVMGILHTKCQQIMDIQECPPTKVMHATLEFDFNLKTFVHAEEPSVIPISQCPQECQDALKHFSNNFENPNLQYALVTCKEFGSQYQRLCPMYFGENSVNQSMEELIQMEKASKGIPLKSDLFDGWEDIRKRNLKEQFDYLKKSPICTGFYHNVMHFFNNKARLSVCDIVIDVKMGKELGQITNFVKYEDMPKSDFKMVAEKVANNVIFDIPPHVQQAVMTLIVYRNIETDAFLYMDRHICKLNKSGYRPVETYKRNADYCFKQLQDLIKKIPSNLVEKVNL
jgi:hypothetical protein